MNELLLNMSKLINKKKSRKISRNRKDKIMKIGKAFLIASGVVVGLAVVGNGAKATLLSDVEGLGTTGRNYACVHSCAQSTGAAVCFLGDSTLLHQLANGSKPQLTDDEVTCLDTYCKNKETGTSTTALGNLIKQLKQKLCTNAKKDSSKKPSSTQRSRKHHWY